ncbi:MAG: PIN domain-containing protein [Betaproteobacteria bacterium]|nr:PIN domain-containing protein [Betaproteobacteria bacterium]
MIAFFDASALIYLIEGKEPFARKVRGQLAVATKEHSNLGAGVSRLTWLECRVRPMKANDSAVLAAFDAFFARTDLVWVELTRDVVELAAAIRVRHGLRTPDSLQAASWHWPDLGDIRTLPVNRYILPSPLAGLHRPFHNSRQITRAVVLALADGGQITRAVVLAVADGYRCAPPILRRHDVYDAYDATSAPRRAYHLHVPSTHVR